MVDNAPPQMLITFVREKGLIGIRTKNFKMGDERFLSAMLEKCIEHFKSNKFKNRLLKETFKQKIKGANGW